MKTETITVNLDQAADLLETAMRNSAGDGLKILCLPNPPGHILDDVAAQIGAALRDGQHHDILILIYRVE